MKTFNNSTRASMVSQYETISADSPLILNRNNNEGRGKIHAQTLGSKKNLEIQSLGVEQELRYRGHEEHAAFRHDSGDLCAELVGSVNAKFPNL